MYGRTDIVSILIKNGSNVNWRDNFGILPIMFGNTLNNWLSLFIFNFKLASAYGRTDIVKLLLDKGASVESSNRYNETALFYGTQIALI
jgi:ankyrin repeat protein